MNKISTFSKHVITCYILLYFFLSGSPVTPVLRSNKCFRGCYFLFRIYIFVCYNVDSHIINLGLFISIKVKLERKQKKNGFGLFSLSSCLIRSALPFLYGAYFIDVETRPVKFCKAFIFTNGRCFLYPLSLQKATRAVCLVML